MRLASHSVINCYTKENRISCSMEEFAFFLFLAMLLNAECSCLYIIQLVPFSSEIWRAFCAPSLRLDYLNCTWDFAVQSQTLRLPHLSLQGVALLL